MSLIRVGIVGAGANTRERHIPGLQAIERVGIRSVANRSPDSAQRGAKAFGIPDVAEHWRAVVESPAIDAVGIWPYLLCPVSLAALAAGKHVLCDARAVAVEI